MTKLANSKIKIWTDVLDTKKKKKIESCFFGPMTLEKSTLNKLN